MDQTMTDRERELEAHIQELEAELEAIAEDIKRLITELGREEPQTLAPPNGHDCPACGFHLSDEDMDLHIRLWHSAAR